MRQMVYSSKDFNFIDFCHDSAKYASIMALAAPKVEEPLVDFPLWAVERNLLLVATLCKSDKVERSTKAEGLPKNISIEELTFPSVV